MIFSGLRQGHIELFNLPPKKVNVEAGLREQEVINYGKKVHISQLDFVGTEEAISKFCQSCQNSTKFVKS